MKKELYKSLFIGLLCIPLALLAQPVNDNCETATILSDLSDYCSGTGEYTNVDATESGYGPATCFPGAGNDVWFTFVAATTDIVISVNGNSFGTPGGTLNSPAIALYTGVCGGLLTQQACVEDEFSAGVVELYKGGLNIGETYLIRIIGGGGTTGTFQLCLNSFNPIGVPSGDAETALSLCDLSSFNVAAVVGAGNVPNELSDATCFQGVANETNVTWFTWTCEQPGPLTFTLTPTNPGDDLDFVLYVLPFGQGNSQDKYWVRCMAAGDFAATSPCMGPTGLQEGATDVEQPPGCPPGNDNWLAPLDMTAGTTYALAVNNFTSTGNGFNISFGGIGLGTGTVAGPDADFSVSATDTVCVGEEVTFTDISEFLTGTLVGWTWNFGSGASTSVEITEGPHVITYSTPGTKTIAFTVLTDIGCQVTVTKTIVVKQCCSASATVSSTDPSCEGGEDGTATIAGPDFVQPVSFNWSNGQSDSTATGLSAGTYYVTATDAVGCIVTDSVTLTDGPPLSVTASMDTAIFEGATIVLTSSATLDSVSFTWTGGGINQTGPTVSVTPLETTIYTVTAATGGCVVSDNVTVTIKDVDFQFPNAFSPNSDEVNDFFGPTGGGIDVVDFKIYDRWGELVWDNPTQSWDGKQNGQEMPSDVYLYLVKVKKQDGTVETRKGDFMLVR